MGCRGVRFGFPFPGTRALEHLEREIQAGSLLLGTQEPGNPGSWEPGVMTQQYVGHMTEDRYGWIAQLVEHPPGTR